MSEWRANEMLAEDPGLMTPSEEQARLESAIFDRFQSISYGHTPGSVERSIRSVEPGQRLLIIHPGPELDVSQLASSVTPQFEAGTWQNGIPALRCGGSNRGVVLFRDGLDAAVILAGVSCHDWMGAVDELDTADEETHYFKRGRVTPEEAASVAIEARQGSRYGSVLIRRIGALYALPHTSIHMYSKSPGRIVEVIQHEPGLEALHGLIRAVEQAGLELVENYSNGVQQTFVVFQHAAEDGPLLIRLVHRPMKFPD